MNEIGCIVLAFRDQALGAQVRRALMAFSGRPVESFEDMPSAQQRVAEGGVELMVLGPVADRGKLESSVSGGLYGGTTLVLVISDESGWPEGIEVLPEEHTPAELEQAVERILHLRERMGQRDYIASMSRYVVPVESLAEAEMHGDGTWSRRVPGGLVEVGVDVRRWLNEGKLLCVEHTDTGVLEASKPYARLLAGDGSAHTLVAPLSGRIREKNTEADGAVCVLASKCATEGWSLWLLRVEPS
jgi:glycine cleavage system H lipoate-binding protein